MRKPNVDITFVLCNPLVELKQSIFDKTIFSIFVLAVKIFYCFRNANQQKSVCETGVLRCYGRQRATNLYYSGSREQIVNERRRDSNAEMFAMVHRDQKARRRLTICKSK